MTMKIERTGSLWVGLLALFLWMGAPAQAASVLSSEAELSVEAYADSFDNDAGTGESDSATDGDIAPGHPSYSNALQVEATTSDATADAQASLDATVDLAGGIAVDLNGHAMVQGEGSNTDQDPQYSTGIPLARSEYEIRFTLGSAGAYTLDGNVDVFNLSDAFGTTFVELLDGGGGIVHRYEVSESTQAFSEAGTLAAGSYTLRALTDMTTGGITGSGTGTFIVQFAAVPEPGTLLLALAGAAMLGGLRRAAVG